MTELYTFLKKSTSHLQNVTYRKAYGLEAVYIKEKAFLLVTKEDEVALRIEDVDFLNKRRESIIMNQLYLHDKPMANWYLVPKKYNKKKNRLIPLIDSSYACLFKAKKKRKASKKIKSAIVPKSEINLVTNTNVNLLRRFIQLFKR